MTRTASAADPANSFNWNLPDWAPRPIVPADNPMSRAKVALGRRLFYEKQLSITGNYSCATCHRQERGFTDGNSVAIGTTGGLHSRNTPGLANIVFAPVLTWANSNLRRLEEQLLTPLFGAQPIELGMGGEGRLLVDRLRGDEGHRLGFQRAFPDSTEPVSIANLAKALAAFQRSLLSFSAPYDRYRMSGVTNAISNSAKRGEKLFFSERLNCFQCHQWPLFTDNMKRQGLPFEEIAFHNTGLYNLDGYGAYPAPNTGLHRTTGQAGDMGRFRTPSLRNVGVTAPYMHDGSVPSLDAVIDIYAAGGHYLKSGQFAGDGRKSPMKSAFLTELMINDREKRDLIAFLNSLTDETFLSNPAYGPLDPDLR